MSVWRNDIKCKYMFMFPLNNLAHKELTIIRPMLNTDNPFATLDPSIPTWLTTSPKSCLLSINKAIKISYLYHIQYQGSGKSQSQISVSCWLLVDIHGLVAFPTMPIIIENPSRLSKSTLSKISISEPLKLTYIISYLTTVHPASLPQRVRNKR